MRAPTALQPRASSSAAARAAKEGFAALRSWHAPLAWLTALMVVWALVSAVGYVVDDRTIAGVRIWAKPLKFTISLGVYAVTLAWMLSRLRGTRLRRVGSWAATLAGAAALSEMTLITLQVARGTTSHFNTSTPFDATVYTLMAAGVSAMYGVTLLLGVALLLTARFEDRALVWALRLGLPISVAGLSVGFAMIVITPEQLAAPGSGVMGSHSVGGLSEGGLAFLGWDTVNGDLRVSHFIGMHALQALPLLALGLRALPTRWAPTESVRVSAILLVGGATASVTALTYWQATRGQSVVDPDAWTLAAAAGLALAGAVSAGALARSARHEDRPDGTASTVEPGEAPALPRT